MVITENNLSESKIFDKDKYEIINILLDSLVIKKKDTIDLDQLTDNKSLINQEVFNSFTTSPGGTCIGLKRNDIFNQEVFTYFNRQLEKGDMLLAKELIKNDSIKLGVELKQKIYVEQHLSRIDFFAANFNTDRDRYKRMLWERENNKGLYTISIPLFNKHKNVALIVFSNNNGNYGWVFEKTKGKWILLCRNGLGIY